MAEEFQYLELWDKLQCAGGKRLGQFLPISPERTLRANGDDAYAFGIPRTNRLAALLRRGAVIREVLSRDGATWREWILFPSPKVSSRSLVVSASCIGLLTQLTNYPIETRDADGFVYTNQPAIQLTPARIITDWILSRTPSYFSVGSVTPTALAEVPFDGDTARSGSRRLEERVRGYEASLRADGGAGYLLDFAALGSSAAPLYIRPGKNLVELRQEGQPGQVTRVNIIRGPNGDDGPSNIAWAFWEVVATSGSGPYRVKLGAYHGGPGPIAFDGQLSHANLPGGANSLYLQLRDGTFRQITGSWGGATQEVQVSSLTTISVGDWVRIVAGNDGLHLTSLDAPDQIGSFDVLAGSFESNWDDTVNIIKNPLMTRWAGTRADGWSGLGAKTTVSGEWLTGGQAIKINQTVSDSTLLCAPPSRTWYINPRKAVLSASMWFRLLALFGNGDMAFYMTVNNGVTSVNTPPIYYASPANKWQQLKVEGFDVSQFAGQVVTVSLTLMKTNGTGTVHMVIDSMAVTPSFSTRAMTEGSNPARTWQDVNGFLEDHCEEAIATTVDFVDLAALGVPAQRPVVLGGTAAVEPTDADPIAARIVERIDRPGDPTKSRFVISTLPVRYSREKTKPLPLVIPFFESIELRVAASDTRNAAMKLWVASQTSDETTVTVTLGFEDSKGATPTILPFGLGGATVLSGSGLGPYVIEKPTTGETVGRGYFIAKADGRTDAEASLDIPVASAIVVPKLDVVVEVVDENHIALTPTVSDPTGSGATIVLELELVNTEGNGSTSGTLSMNYSGPIVSGEVLVMVCPGVNDPAATATIKPSVAGQASVPQVFTIPNVPAPTLSADIVDQDDDTVTVEYEASNTPTASLRGTPVTIGSSPWVITRAAAGAEADIYAISCSRGGATETKLVTVAAKLAVPASLPRIEWAKAEGDDAGDFVLITWSGANAPGGAAYDVAWEWTIDGVLHSSGVLESVSSGQYLYAPVDLMPKTPGTTVDVALWVQPRMIASGTIVAFSDAYYNGYGV